MDGTTIIILDSIRFSSPPPDVLNGSLCARGPGATFRQPVVYAFAQILYLLELPQEHVMRFLGHLILERSPTLSIYRKTFAGSKHLYSFPSARCYLRATHPTMRRRLVHGMRQN